MYHILWLGTQPPSSNSHTKCTRCATKLVFSICVYQYMRIFLCFNPLQFPFESVMCCRLQCLQIAENAANIPPIHTLSLPPHTTITSTHYHYLHTLPLPPTHTTITSTSTTDCNHILFLRTPDNCWFQIYQ